MTMKSSVVVNEEFRDAELLASVDLLNSNGDLRVANAHIRVF